MARRLEIPAITVHKDGILYKEIASCDVRLGDLEITTSLVRAVTRRPDLYGRRCSMDVDVDSMDISSQFYREVPPKAPPKDMLNYLKSLNGHMPYSTDGYSVAELIRWIEDKS